MKKGKSRGQAVIRTLANKDAQNFATKRLLRDLEEIEKNPIPTVGVVARPLDKDLFIWHANIRGPENTPYQGGIFHLVINIPQNYPHSPPSIIIPSKIPHPNVFDNTVCLDMLQEQGWSSAYTILSILIQLQSFLFEKNYDQSTNLESQIKKAVEESNLFKCTESSCKHGGKLACYPPFNQNETNAENFKILESEKGLFEKEIICYHTKQGLKEASIGIGINITRVPRTGAISQANPCLDFISLKAFMKEGIRFGIDKQKFMNWLPLYFGLDKQKILHLGKKAISMIFTNNTKRFKENMLIELFPKILLTLNFLMMDEKIHCSIRFIRLWTHIHSLFLLFLESFPRVYDEIEKILDEFLADENKRLKDSTPNLGIILFYVLVSRKHTVDQFIAPYFNEQLDRQVFWLLQAVPELGEEQFDKNFGEQRAQHTFKVQSTSFQMFALSVMMIRDIKGKKQDKELLKEYEENLGKLFSIKEEDIQKKCFEILKFKSFDDFFENIGMKKLSNEQLMVRLKEAISNSKKKKYHGNVDDVFSLPTPDEQIKVLKEKEIKLEDFIDKEKKTLIETDWKEACKNRYLFIKEALEITPNIEPSDLQALNRKKLLNKSEKPDDLLAEMRIKYLSDHKKFSLPTQIPIKFKKYSWKELFIQLDLQDHLRLMDLYPDFKNFYEKLNASKDFIENLIIPIIPLKYLKSGYHYLTALFTNLTNLKEVAFIGSEHDSWSVFNLKALKCVSKGYANFIKNGGKLERLTINKFVFDNNKLNDSIETLWQTILAMGDLHSLILTENQLLNYELSGKYISNFITTQKNLNYLDLSNSSISSSQAKLIADGLMRAKQIETLILKKNQLIGHEGMSSILYNLAFSPKLRFLDISEITYNVTTGLKVVVESLYKLLRISGSLEILNMSNSAGLNLGLTKEFFVSLGEIKSLKTLDINNSGVFVQNGLLLLGKSIAFNAKKNGNLEILNMENCIINNEMIGHLEMAMNISKADEEDWYGDPNKVSKMSGNDFQKIYYNNLKVLNFSKGTNLNSGFNLAHWKKKYNPTDPELVILLARSQNLSMVKLDKCGLGKNEADLLTLALDPTRANFLSKIKLLNISENKLGKEGCKIISQIFKINNIIEIFDISSNQIGVSGAQSLAEALENNTSLIVLNLFANTIDVDGARSFEKTLSKNKKLEWIDFGHNRLRDEGVLSLARGIHSNSKSSIKTLGLRFNFISGEGISDFFNVLYGGKNNNGELKNIFIKNNDINEYELNILKRRYEELKLNIYVDSFDKFQFLENERLERTIWIHPTICTSKEIQNFLENEHKCGIVLDIRKRKGPKWSNRNKTENNFFFIEFANKLSVTRALQIASKKLSVIRGKTFRIFKGGSGTYLFSKNCISKKNTNSVTNVIASGRGRPQRGSRGGFRGSRGKRPAPRRGI